MIMKNSDINVIYIYLFVNTTVFTAFAFGPAEARQGRGQPTAPVLPPTTVARRTLMPDNDRTISTSH